MAKIEIYTVQYCGYCMMAKQLLQRKGHAFEEHDLSALSDEELHRTLQELAGRRTVPQVVINGRPVGGYDDLRRLDQAGELDRLLAE